MLDCLLLINTVVIMASFVWFKYWLFIIAIIIREFDILILKQITLWYMTSLLIFIDLQWFCYFIKFYIKMTNGEMVKWCMIKWCKGEIKIRKCCFVSHNYWIFSFVLFLNTIFLQQIKENLTFNFWSQTTITATKFMLSYYATTEVLDLSGVSRLLWRRLWLWFKFLTSPILGNIIL